MRSSSPACRVRSVLAACVGGLAREGRFLGSLLRWLPVWLLVVGTLLGAGAAYQSVRDYSVDVGSPQDQAYTRNFHARLDEAGRTYRWSDVYGYVHFPGLGGSRPFTVTTTIDSARTAPVQVFINGERFLSRDLGPGWQTFTFAVDSRHSSALASRDTVVEFRSSDYRDPDAPAEPKGLKVDGVAVQVSRAGGLIVPSLSTLLYLVGSVLLVYWLVGRLLRSASTLRTLRWRALAVAVLAAMLLCSALALDHVAVSAAAQHIAVTLASALAILVLAEAWLGRWKGMTWGQRRLLAASVVGAFVLRYGGMALPQSVIIDMPYHMKWLRTLLAGDWQALYFPGGLSEVPPEWGMSLLIPKSPLFYGVIAPVSIIPFDLEILVKWLICLLDSSLVLCVYRLTERLTRRKDAAVFSAGLYAVMPLVFRAFAYGILPTIFAQWLAVLLFVALLSSGRAWSVWRWLLIIALATLTVLAFPTVAVFVTLVVVAVPLAWRYIGRGERGWRWQPYAVLVVAWALAVWLYYGLYIGPVVASAQALLAPAQNGGTTVKWPAGPLQVLAWTADYVVSLLPALLAVVGVAVLLARRRLASGQRRTLWLVLAWLMIAPIFTIANYKVDMIGKHLFFTVAPVAVVGGFGLLLIGRRGGWGRLLATLLFVTVAWQALAFWVARLVSAST